MEQLPQLPDHLKKKFVTHFTEMTINGRQMMFLEIDNLENIIGEILNPTADSGGQRPFWVKIWPSAILLGHYLSKIEVNTQKRMLEIGAGMGVAGITAASFGHHITITDNNEDALSFARVNAAANGLPDLSIRNLDWAAPNDHKKWDVIFGSDVIYLKEGINSLIDFLRSSLKPSGKIYFTLSPFIRGKDFFEKSADYFTIEKKGLVLKSEKEKIPLFLCTLSFK